MFKNLVTPSEEIVNERLAAFRDQFAQAAKVMNGRTERAARLASTPGACQYSGEGFTFQVRSETNGLGYYTVDLAAHTCTCPDHPGISAKKGICKHRLAIAIILNFTQPQDLTPFVIDPMAPHTPQPPTVPAEVKSFLTGIKPETETNAAALEIARFSAFDRFMAAYHEYKVRGQEAAKDAAKMHLQTFFDINAKIGNVDGAEAFHNFLNYFTA